MGCRLSAEVCALKSSVLDSDATEEDRRAGRIDGEVTQYTYIYIYMYIYIYVYNIYIYIYYLCVCVCQYTYMHIDDTYIHMYMYTYEGFNQHSGNKMRPYRK